MHSWYSVCLMASMMDLVSCCIDLFLCGTAPVLADFAPLVFLYYSHVFPSFLNVRLSVGLVLEHTSQSSDEFRNRESFSIVAFAWLSAAVFGALPFLFSGMQPVDALFESMSGFTATGATIMTDIESYSMALLFWRSFIQWIGSMGIIMLFLAILPKLAVDGRQLFKAEVPKPTKDKLKPRFKETAKILWMVYMVLSVVEFITLLLAGMGVYDGLTHTFITIACGGFSPRADSIAAFNNPLIEGIITFFMFVAGANVALHYRLLYLDHRSLLKDGEFKFYSFIVVKVVRLLLMLKYAYRELFRSLQPKLVRPIRLGERVVPEDGMNSIFSFIILYILV